MHFYEYIYFISYIFSYIGVFAISNTDLKIYPRNIPQISPCSVGLQFLVDVNNTSTKEDYALELTPDQCCLEIDGNLDCDVLETIGSCTEVLPKGSKTTLRLVAPILDPYERHGYCIAYLDSKGTIHKRYTTMRDSMKIPFDTRIKRHIKNDKIPYGAKVCKKVDQDPLDDCKPVDCEVFYNGHKSFYHKLLKKCVEVPKCLSASDEEMPSSLYDPINNNCKNDDPLTKDDINYLKDLTHKVKHGRVAKDIVIIKKYQDKPSKTDVYNFENADKTLKRFNTLYKKDKKKKEKHNKYKCWWECTLDYLRKNQIGLIFLGGLIVLQCCLLMLMIYFLAKKCFCKPRNDLENQYFNYRQDASVTTPLIGTTNIETETTCQFMSESSNVEKKIQCYKACQKENPKVSMSDDILSKCLNRRNWDHKQVKSDAVDMSKLTFGDKVGDKSTNNFETLYVSTKKQTGTKTDANIERDSKDEKKTKPVKTVEGKKETKGKRKDLGDSEVAPSEKELKCYNYSEMKIPKLESEKEIKCHSYNYMIDAEKSNQSSRVQKKNIVNEIYRTERADQSRTERQASAQASFSNDSIDDLLSERGVFLTSDNVSDTSKYSFSNESVRSISAISSKTSKNIVKSVLSYFKRPKNPSSEPGGKKSKDVINLELIHLSKASMYSSSNNEAECLRTLGRVKDSRTSL